jgi:RNA polymerase sigma-70 factor (ECF subfamily)
MLAMVLSWMGCTWLKWGSPNRFQAPLLPPSDDLQDRIQAERPYLLRYASLQLRDRDAAEDAVQETLLAALTGASGFAGRSNLRTWLTGILKHKIVDHIRRASREPAAPDPGEGDESDFDALFDQRGHWVDPPRAWDNPEGALEQGRLRAVLEECLKGLPARTAQAFMMREHLGLDTPELCKALGVTPTHSWVLLYRARMALRLCLEKNGFGQ